MKKWHSLIVTALILFVVAQIIGLGSYLLRHPPIFVADNTDFSNTPLIIPVDKAYQMFTNNSALFIDTRSREEYNMGHIPNAIYWNSIKEFFHRNRKINRADSLVFYCSQGCESALHEAQFVAKRINKPVMVLFGGFEIWSANGYPQQTMDK